MSWYWYLLIAYAVMMTAAFLIQKFSVAPDPVEKAEDEAYEKQKAEEAEKQILKGGATIEYPSSVVMKCGPVNPDTAPVETKIVEHTEPLYAVDKIDAPEDAFENLPEHIQETKELLEKTIDEYKDEAVKTSIVMLKRNIKDLSDIMENPVKENTDFQTALKQAEESYIKCKKTGDFPGVVEQIKLARDYKNEAIGAQRYEKAASVRQMERNFLFFLHKLCGNDVSEFLSDKLADEMIAKFTEDELRAESNKCCCDECKCEEPVDVKTQILDLIKSKHKQLHYNHVSLEQFKQFTDVLNKYGIKSVESQLNRLSKDEVVELFTELKTL